MLAWACFWLHCSPEKVDLRLFEACFNPMLRSSTQLGESASLSEKTNLLLARTFDELLRLMTLQQPLVCYEQLLRSSLITMISDSRDTENLWPFYLCSYSICFSHEELIRASHKHSGVKTTSASKHMTSAQFRDSIPLVYGLCILER